MATSPPHDPANLELNPPPLSDTDFHGIKDVLAGHDLTFASINAVSKESANRKQELEESTPRGESGADLNLEIIGAVQESTSASIRGTLNEWHARETERTKALVAELAVSMSGHFENSVQRAVESLASSREAHVGFQDAGRSYPAAVWVPGAAAGPPLGGSSERALTLLEMIEVTPTGAMGDKLSDAQATCNTVLSSIKPSEMGIKIDRVIKSRHKSVRIVAGHDDIDKLKLMLDNLGMQVKPVNKLNPRL
ncbi:hypothetical protein RF55_17016 [Lasius niger]|uniref:Uncharacterized protein n=1 Tax=Lasius niger TaxID=67767 RepID=A0A0J7K340_LASNI|nr:hypothetical protein RF55_17016 [Lasius niger]